MARNLAARLAGSHVIFSPSFDDPYAASSALLDGVGTALSAAAPRHLITAHLAGSSSSNDYIGPGGVHFLPWHGLEVFQSGHAYNLAPCGTNNQYQCAVRRAREMSSLISDTTPLQPTFNGEAAYDNTLSEAPTQQIDSPYGARHTGYNTTLNGGLGFTLGVKGLWDWSLPTAAGSLGSAGSREIKILGDQFRNIPWSNLRAQFSLIKNQPAAEEKKASMASYGNQTHTLVYMPDDPSVDLDLSKAVEKGFSCTSSAWTITWMNPKNGSPDTPGTCSQLGVGGATHRLTRPTCTAGGPSGGCDWLVTIHKTGSQLAASATGAPALDVWTEPSANGRTMLVRGRLKGASAEQLTTAFDVGEPASGSALVPVVANLPGHAFLIVWETTSDGYLHGVQGQRIAANGSKAGVPFAVNLTTAYDQSSPWVAALPGYGGLVTWTSDVQDGDRGGIFARRIGLGGLPVGPEIQVNEYTIGRQDLSQVAACPSGNFVVGWTSWGQDGDAEGVFARRLDSNGKPLGPEFPVNQTTLGAQILTDVSTDSKGGFTIRWESEGPNGKDQGLFRRRYAADGTPPEGEVLVVPPTTEETVPGWPGQVGG